MSLPHEAAGNHLPDFLAALGHCALLSLLVLSCHMGSRVPKPRQSTSLRELEALCDLPVACGTPVACEGRMVSLRGFVDPAHIFSRQRFPKTPGEKFRLVITRVVPSRSGPSQTTTVLFSKNWHGDHQAKLLSPAGWKRSGCQRWAVALNG